VIRCLLPLCLVLATSSAVTGPEHGRRSAAGRAPFARFIGTVIRNDRAQFHVPGIAFVAVRGGKILDSAGYGEANLAQRTPVSATHTVFELGAVSSILTTICALVLADTGRVGLRQDVNRYLDGVHVPELGGRHVTLAALLTNTAGLGEPHIGRRTLDPHDVRPLRDYLRSALPPQVRPAGVTYSYSSFSFGLVGYLVQDVSHRPFARYVNRHVFGPLRMERSSARQPTPPELLRQMATGYDVSESGTTAAAPREFFNLAPAEGMVSTAEDMGRLLVALLSPRGARRGRIVSARVIRELEASHFSSYPRILGFPPFPSRAYGFGRYYQNGHLVVEESGTVRGFSDLLALLPRQDFGFFIAGNTARSDYLFDVQRRLLDRYFPARRKTHRYPGYQSTRFPLTRFTGSYWSDEYDPDTIEKLRQLVNQVDVSASGATRLTAHFWSGQTVSARRVAPLLFQVGAGDTFWAFQLGARGRVIRMVPGGNSVYDRIPWDETTDVQLVYVAILLLIILSGIAVWLVVPLVRGSTHIDSVPAGIVSALNMVFVALLGLAMWSAVSTQAEHYSWLEYGSPLWVYLLLCLPLVTVALTPILVSVSIVRWVRGVGSTASRLHHSLVAAAALAFIPFLTFWNLLGFHV